MKEARKIVAEQNPPDIRRKSALLQHIRPELSETCRVRQLDGLDQSGRKRMAGMEKVSLENQNFSLSLLGRHGNRNPVPFRDKPKLATGGHAGHISAKGTSSKSKTVPDFLRETMEFHSGGTGNSLDFSHIEEFHISMDHGSPLSVRAGSIRFESDRSGSVRTGRTA